MTARVIIRLSAKLEAAGHYVDSDDEGQLALAGEGGVLIDLTNRTSLWKSEAPKHPFANNYFIHYDPSTPKAPLRTEAPAIISARTSTKPKQAKIKTPFSHAGMFDALDDVSVDDEDSVHSDYTQPPSSSKAFPAVAASMDEWATSPPPAPKVLDASEQPASRLMPPWDSDFWNVYGNKLRVNGTVEGVYDLSGR